MSTPERPEADVQEQQETLTGDAPRDRPEDRAGDLPLEATPADALEQSADPAPAEHRVDRPVPADVPEADAVEQAEVVHLDEDEYR